MKTLSKKKIAIGLLGFTLLSGSCSDDFLERYPTSNYTGESFYTSDEAVLKAGMSLYNRAWFNFNRRALISIGSYRANDAWNPYVGPEFARFQTTALTPEVLQAWSSLFTVVTMSNSILHDLTYNVGSEVSAGVRNQAMGEAYLMRGTSYFYMLRIWGPTILFEDNDQVVLSPNRPLNPEEDVLRFVIRDFRRAAELLPELGSDGRASRYAAKALLAKALLARSGWNKGGTRDQADLDECIELCRDVIENSGASLIDYEDLFKYQFNDNAETLLAMKWASPITGGWGECNAILSDVSFSEVCDVNCWGGNLAASIDMLQLYNDEPAEKNKRLKATFFTEGCHYDYIKSAHGGYTYTKKWIQLKKGVVGSKEDVDGQLAQMASPLNTYIIRLADVYLTCAEAALGNNAELSGGYGLECFNAIRTRAGVPTKSRITFEDIIRERRVEFCMEYCNWFDMVTWFRWRPDYMLDYFNNKQYRGLQFTEGDIELNENPEEDGIFRYTFPEATSGVGTAEEKTYWSDGIRDKDGELIETVDDGYVFDIRHWADEGGIIPVVVTAESVFMPYPEADVLQNPYLSQEPQPYDFGESEGI